MKKIFINCAGYFNGFTLEEIESIYIDNIRSTDPFLILRTTNGDNFFVYSTNDKLYVKALMNLIIQHFNFDSLNVSHITHEDLNTEYQRLKECNK